MTLFTEQKERLSINLSQNIKLFVEFKNNAHTLFFPFYFNTL